MPELASYPLNELIDEVRARIDKTNGLDFCDLDVVSRLRDELTATLAARGRA